MKICTPAQIAAMTADELLTYLAGVAAELSGVDSRQKELWATRIAVYQEGRRRVPPVTHGRLADAAGVSEVAIITKLRQLEDRAAAG